NLERVARVAGVIAEEMGLFEEEVRMIELAAPLHDIGKIAMPDSLLMKPGPLDDEETALMRKHPQFGYELLSGSQNRFIQLSATIDLYHQERFDGSGYPEGLRGNAIPVEARIVAVADVFDALISERPYKPAWSLEEAFAYIVDNRGKLFDPACVDALMRDRERVEELALRLGGAGQPQRCQQ